MSNLPIQLIITSTNRDYCMVCISVYGNRASFFDISCTQTLFCPEISLVRLESLSLILPLSSDTSHEGLHRVQHSVNSPQSARGRDFSPILLYKPVQGHF